MPLDKIPLNRIRHDDRWSERRHGLPRSQQLLRNDSGPIAISRAVGMMWPIASILPNSMIAADISTARTSAAARRMIGVQRSETASENATTPAD